MVAAVPIVSILGPVHTHLDKFENAIFYPVWAFVHAKAMFSNIRNRTFLKTLSGVDKFENAISVDGQKWNFLKMLTT